MYTYNNLIHKPKSLIVVEHSHMKKVIQEKWKDAVYTCLESKSSYEQNFPKILNYYFEDDKAEKINELLTHIENAISNKLLKPINRFYALTLLRSAAERPSTNFADCLAKNQGLCRSIFKITIKDKQLDSPYKGKDYFDVVKESRTLQLLGANIIKLAIESIHYWKIKFGDDKYRSSAIFNNLFNAARIQGVKFNSKFVFFNSDEIDITGSPPKKGLIREEDNNEVLETAPEGNTTDNRFTSSSNIDPQSQSALADQRNEYMPQEIEDENSSVYKDPGSKKSNAEEQPSANYLLNLRIRLHERYREYCKLKETKGLILQDLISSEENYIRKAKEILIDLSLPILKLKNESRKIWELPRSADEELGTTLGQDINNAYKEYYDLQNFLTRIDDDNLPYTKILNRCSDFFGHGYPNLSINSQAGHSPNNSNRHSPAIVNTSGFKYPDVEIKLSGSFARDIHQSPQQSKGLVNSSINPIPFRLGDPNSPLRLNSRPSDYESPGFAKITALNSKTLDNIDSKPLDELEGVESPKIVMKKSNSSSLTELDEESKNSNHSFELAKNKKDMNQSEQESGKKISFPIKPLPFILSTLR